MSNQPLLFNAALFATLHNRVRFIGSFRKCRVNWLCKQFQHSMYAYLRNLCDSIFFYAFTDQWNSSYTSDNWSISYCHVPAACWVNSSWKRDTQNFPNYCWLLIDWRLLFVCAEERIKCKYLIVRKRGWIDRVNASSSGRSLETCGLDR